MSAQVGGVVLDGQLLPLLDTPPGLQPQLGGAGVQAELGVAHTAVVEEGEGREYRPSTDSCQEVNSFRDRLHLNWPRPHILLFVKHISGSLILSKVLLTRT